MVPPVKSVELNTVAPVNLPSYVERQEALPLDLIDLYGLNGVTPPREAVRHCAKSMTLLRQKETLYHIVYVAFHYIHTLGELISNGFRERHARREWQAAGMREHARVEDVKAVDELFKRYDRYRQRSVWLEQKRDSITELLLILARRQRRVEERNPAEAGAMTAKRAREADSDEWSHNFELVYSKLLKSLGQLDDWDKEIVRISALWDGRDPSAAATTLSTGMTDPATRGKLETALEESELRAQAVAKDIKALEQRVKDYAGEVARLQALLEAETALSIADEDLDLRAHQQQVQLDALRRSVRAADAVVSPLGGGKDQSLTTLTPDKALEAMAGRARELARLNDEHLEQLQLAQDELNETQAWSDQLEGRCQELDEEFRDYQKRAMWVQEALVRTRAEFEDAHQLFITFDDILNRRELELSYARGENAELKLHNERLQREIEERDMTIDGLKQSISGLEDHLARLRQDLAGANGAIGDLHRASDSLGNELAAEKNARTDLDSRLAAATTDGEHLREKLAREEDKTRELEQTLQGKSAELAATTSERDHTRGELEQKERELVELAGELEARLAELNELNERHKELRGVRDRLDGELKASQSDGTRLRDELSARHNELARAREELEERAAALDALTTSLRNTEFEVEKRDTQVARLDAELAALRDKSGILSVESAQAAELVRLERERLTTDIEKLRDQLDKLAREHSGVKERLTNAEEENSLLIKALSRADEDRKFEQRDLTDQVEKFKKETGERHERLLEFEAKVEELQDRLAASLDTLAEQERAAGSAGKRVSRFEELLNRINDLRRRAENTRNPKERVDLATQAANELDEAVRFAGGPVPKAGGRLAIFTLRDEAGAAVPTQSGEGATSTATPDSETSEGDKPRKRGKKKKEG